MLVRIIQIISLIKEIGQLQSSHYRKVSTDPFGTGRGSHFGNQWFRIQFAMNYCTYGRL